MEVLDVTDLARQAANRGLEWFGCPIMDFDTPRGPFERAWSECAGARGEWRTLRRSASEAKQT